MAGEIQKHLWADLANAPAGPGIYAWYFSPQITDFDLDRAIEEINALRDTDRGQAERAAKAMLDERIFRHFREEPYQAIVEGPLKPAYRGALEHASEISSGLVSRVVDDPERLRSLRNILDRSAPMFASPLYIGMSVNLCSRLATHKSLIERYRVARVKERPSSRNSDAGFAWQIARRQISPDRLMVFTCITAGDYDKTAVDIENVLNRLYYPILGRN